MDPYFRKRPADGSDGSPPSEAWLFAQSLLGKPVPCPFRAEADARARREHLEWLAQISPEDARRVRGRLSEDVDIKAQQDLLEWVAEISGLREAEWDSSKHPRVPKGQSDGGQWVATGGSGGANATKQPSFLDAMARRNAAVAGLTGATTPNLTNTSSLAAKLQSAAQLAGEMARAAAAGLWTGVKANVNGFATTVKSVATLGLTTSQLELIGVTKEDRDRGYDTAVAISTASGQVLLAVGTSGLAAALSKGGTITRTASGALIAFNAAGNAVGVVQGVYDATQNGVSISNGAQVAGGLLGLGANAAAVKGMKTPASPKEIGPSGFRSPSIDPKIQGQMGPRGWSPQQINEAIQGGRQVPAINRATGNPAIRYVHPTTGQSVVVDKITGEVIHVGGPGFQYGPGAGDVPLLPAPRR